MIKLKLKKALFKVQAIYNDKIQIQLMNQANQQIQNIPKVGESIFQQLAQPQKKNSRSNNLHIQIKPKYRSKSKSKLQNRDNILKLLQTSRRQEEQTNLMQEIPSRRIQFQDNSFQFNQGLQYEPLFKTSQPNQNVKISKKQLLNSIDSQVQKKSISPFSKKQGKVSPNLTYNANHSPKNKSSKPINGTFKSKPTHKQNFSTLGNNSTLGFSQKPETIKKPNTNKTTAINVKNPSVRIKTQGQQIRISQQQQSKEDLGQFRFTIKMTKQQYANLLKMKEALNKNKAQK